MSAKLQIGLHADLPAEDYHAPRLGVVSNTALGWLRPPKTPAHYYAWATGQVERSSPALTFGRAGHCAIFEPERFSQLYIEEPNFGDCRFKESKLARDEWRAANDDREHISAKDMAKIRAVQRSIHRHDLVRKLLAHGRSEMAMVWRDKESGLICKGRVDFYAERFATVVDLKLVDDASWNGFSKSVARWYYHVQDALYRDGFEALDRPVKHFIFVAIEKSPPFASAAYELDAAAVGRGSELARSGIELMVECLRKNEWPAYPPGIQTLSLPNWAA